MTDHEHRTNSHRLASPRTTSTTLHRSAPLHTQQRHKCTSLHIPAQRRKTPHRVACPRTIPNKRHHSVLHGTAKHRSENPVQHRHQMHHSRTNRHHSVAPHASSGANQQHRTQLWLHLAPKLQHPATPQTTQRRLSLYPAGLYRMELYGGGDESSSDVSGGAVSGWALTDDAFSYYDLDLWYWGHSMNEYFNIPLFFESYGERMNKIGGTVPEIFDIFTVFHATHFPPGKRRLSCAANSIHLTFFL